MAEVNTYFIPYFYIILLVARPIPMVQWPPITLRKKVEWKELYLLLVLPYL